MPSIYITDAFTGVGLNGVRLTLTGPLLSDKITGVTKNDMLGGSNRDGVFLYTFPGYNRDYLVAWSGPGVVADSQQFTLGDNLGIGILTKPITPNPPIIPLLGIGIFIYLYLRK